MFGQYYSIAGMMVAVNDGSAVQYLLTDHLGSTVAVTNSSGTLTSQQRYLPFGGTRAIPNSPILGTDFGYTGQRLLDSGMGGIMDYKARFYSVGLGRFLQPDSIIPNPANPQSWNRFSYVRNNPINFNDPSGHIEDDCKSNTRECKDSKLTPEDVLKKYNVNLETANGGNWSDAAKWAAVIAVIKVGYRLAQQRNLKTNGHETGSQAFLAVFGSLTLTWDPKCDGCRGGKKTNGKACGSDFVSKGCVPGGGVTSGAHSITFASLTGDNYNDMDRMTKNIVHELGHAYLNGHSDDGKAVPGLSRDALIRNESYPNGERYDWEQHPISMNADGVDRPNELFADSFIAWTYGAWNPTPQDPLSVSNAQAAMNGFVPQP